MIAGQHVGFVATLLCGAAPLKYQTFLRFSYGPEYAAQIAASATEYVATRNAKYANLKASARRPPEQDKAMKVQKAADIAASGQEGYHGCHKAAHMAARAPSLYSLPVRSNRGKRKRMP
jgi:hypothetical protein